MKHNSQMNVVVQANIVRDSGGHLAAPSLPSPAEFAADLKRYAPGCGCPTRVMGTNGGFMRCGGRLKHLDGTVERYFCAVCSALLKDGRVKSRL